jgi:hypothetical protein
LLDKKCLKPGEDWKDGFFSGETLVIRFAVKRYLLLLLTSSFNSDDTESSVASERAAAFSLANASSLAFCIDPGQNHEAHCAMAGIRICPCLKHRSGQR